MSTLTRTDFIKQIFTYQCEVALQNLAKLYAVVGDKATAIFVTGTDFGAQNAPFITPRKPVMPVAALTALTVPIKPLSFVDRAAIPRTLIPTLPAISRVGPQSIGRTSQSRRLAPTRDKPTCFSRWLLTKIRLGSPGSTLVAPSAC